MDLAELKNMDIKDLLSKFKGSGGILDDKKLLVKFGIGFGSIIIFLIIYYVFVSPEVYDRKTRINAMNKNDNKITEYNINMVRLKHLVKKLKPKFDENSKLFYNEKEAQDLYQKIIYKIFNNFVILASFAVKYYLVFFIFMFFFKTRKTCIYFHLKLLFIDSSAL